MKSGKKRVTVAVEWVEGKEESVGYAKWVAGKEESVERGQGYLEKGIQTPMARGRSTKNI